MGINYNPRTVTDGLVLALDAGNAKSYPGSGTTWSDLSGNGNNGTFTNGPGYSGAAIQFDGNGDYLTTAASNENNFGSVDFSIEFWINSTKTGRVDPFGWNYPYAAAGWAGFVFNLSGSGSISWYENTNSRITALSTGWNNGSWNHIALTRNVNSLRLFVNGNQVGSYTTSFSYGANNSGFIIGDITEGGAPLDGYISNLRITKGVARYTSNFTPPTAPFPSNSTDDSDYNNVSLLLYGTDLEDTSPTPKTITVNGDTNVNSNVGNPFSLVRSIDFDGTDDEVTTGKVLIPLTGEFHIEGWVYPNTTNTTKIFVAQYFDQFDPGRFLCFFGSDGLIRMHDGVGPMCGTPSYSANVWQYVCFQRDASNNCRIFLNANSSSSEIRTTTLENTNTLIGTRGSLQSGVWYNGKISNIRIYNRALTASEVEQNFNALRGRFGI